MSEIEQTNGVDATQSTPATAPPPTNESDAGLALQVPQRNANAPPSPNLSPLPPHSPIPGISHDDPHREIAAQHRKQLAQWLKESVTKHKLLVLVFIRGSWDAWCRNYCQSIALHGLPVAKEIGAVIGIITAEDTNGAAYLSQWLNTQCGVHSEDMRVWSDPDLLFAKKYGIEIIPLTRVQVKIESKDSASTSTAEGSSTEAAATSTTNGSDGPTQTVVKLDPVKWALGEHTASQLARVLESKPNEYPHGITPAALAFIAKKHDFLLQRWQATPTFNNLHGATDRPKPDTAILHVWDKYSQNDASAGAGAETTVHEWKYAGPEMFRDTDPKGYQSLLRLYERECPEYAQELVRRQKEYEDAEKARIQHEQDEKDKAEAAAKAEEDARLQAEEDARKAAVEAAAAEERLTQ